MRAVQTPKYHIENDVLDKVYYFDDFDGASLKAEHWATDITGTGSNATMLTDGPGGIIRLEAKAWSGANVEIYYNRDVVSGSQNAQCLWRLQMGQTTDIHVMLGFRDPSSLNYAVFWRYDTSVHGTTWRMETRNSGWYSDSSGITGDTNWHEFGIRWMSGRVFYYYDGVFKGERTAEVPTTDQCPGCRIVLNSATTKHVDVDWVEYYNDRET